MPLRTVLIDVGGTLLEEKTPRAELYAAEARALGRDVDASAMAALMREAHDALPVEVEGGYRYSDRWFEAFMARIFRDRLGVAEAELARVRERLFARFSDPATFRLLPGASELLDELDRLGLRAAAVSNWSTRLELLLERLGLRARLAAVVSSAVERREKPDPALFRVALERTATAAAEALHVGDHPEKDVAGARAAGIEAVLYDPRGAHRALDLPRVESHEELARLVRERAA